MKFNTSYCPGPSKVHVKCPKERSEKKLNESTNKIENVGIDHFMKGYKVMQILADSLQNSNAIVVVILLLLVHALFSILTPVILLVLSKRFSKLETKLGIPSTDSLTQFVESLTTVSANLSPLLKTALMSLKSSNMQNQNLQNQEHEVPQKLLSELKELKEVLINAQQ